MLPLRYASSGSDAPWRYPRPLFKGIHPDFATIVADCGAAIIAAARPRKRIMTLISKRVVLHFPGFEPLDGRAHWSRYARSAKQSAAVWKFSALASEPEYGSDSTSFKVQTSSDGWETSSHIHVFDHNALVEGLRTGSRAAQIRAGFWSAFQVIAYGGVAGYFSHAWRFGLFFVFPFLMMILGFSLSATIAVIPIGMELPGFHLLWSAALALCFFGFVFLPFAERFYTLHLFADWHMAVALARMNKPEFNQWLDRCATAARAALSEPADEYVISSHSMGSSVAAHVIGILLERHAGVFAGKRVIFATLGSAILQCALLRPAQLLRSRVGLIARCDTVEWLDVQCLTDAIHFYKVPVVAVCGHGDARPAKMVFIRVKQMLTVEHYRKIKKDFLRVHRQYVLGPDLRAPFDFTLLTAGPRSGSVFAGSGYNKMPGM
ncbi:hypothetical protein SAMN05216228_1011196 [Rhizobium tibeticum]|uniref:Transmembrane protein n=2 Tax=Rhizobium tibeticum TaxID=501024 RepID=A0A1H8LXY3_9HYPH|nr:hypothetical protein RTCCBAU85039_2844 [Rhizobium tibeticum]SEO09870.1 hypothetical protein SAMN05216228_1011196 [Rhizobium tibeticum]